MRLLALLDGRDTLARQRPQHDCLRLAGTGSRRLECVDDGGDVVAVDLLRLPAEGAPLFTHRLHVEDDRAVGLDAVAVDDGDEVVELEMGTGHRRLPGRSLLHLAVG